MRQHLENSFFPYVIKPGRYAGGELGQVVKDPAGHVSYVHAYPDKYEIGQSYVGLQSLYHIVNQDDRFLCERLFAVDRDAEQVMRDKSIPLFSLENSRPVKQFDALGFTLVDELVYTNVLTMLDLADIPIRSVDRTEEDPIVMAGGPAVFNPEPLAPFMDLFFIGDGEEGLIEILSVLHELRGEPRDRKLEELARRVKSTYVPKFYDSDARPLVDFVPEKIEARVVPSLKPEYYPDQPILPLVDTVHNHLGVEIMRGCPQGCKFCFAGPIYRPVRPRPVSDIIEQVEKQIANTGYDEVSLQSLSATDYPHLEKLVSSLSRRLELLGVSLTLPSLRPGSITPTLLDSLKRIRKGNMTIAPEAGTERLRLLIRKDFPDAAVYDTVRLTLSKGWTTIKLYFMVGLPTETEEDLLGIADICRNVRKIGRELGKKITVNVALSPFIPKPHTPFQWDEALPEQEMFEKIKFVKKRALSGGVQIRYNSTRLAMLSTLLGRGDREMANVIQTAFEKGCRFDSWSEEFSPEKWMESFAEHGIDTAERMKPIPFSNRLPWSHIVKGPSVEHLIKERQMTSTQLTEFVPRFRETETGNNDDTTAFGRGKRRVIGRTQIAPTKNRVRLRWGKTVTLRYMSHLENLMLIERALRRAHMPVSYSQGYNPTMRLSLGPPLPLGYTSEAELVDVTLESNLTASMIEKLDDALPAGVSIYNARPVLGKRSSLSSMLNRVEYTLLLDVWDVVNDLDERIQSLLDAPTLECERRGKKEIKTVDIRPAVYDVRVSVNKLVMILGLGEGGYARANEVVGFLCQGINIPVAALPFHRRDMYRIDENGNRIDAMDV